MELESSVRAKDRAYRPELTVSFLDPGGIGAMENRYYEVFEPDRRGEAIAQVFIASNKIYIERGISRTNKVGNKQK